VNRNDLYLRLPPIAQDLAATASWVSTGRWRYDARTDDLVAAARERETWGPQRWADWQGEHLERLLHHAARNVPWYREHWAARRRRGDRAAVGELTNWPVLTRAELRADPDAFLADPGTRERRLSAKRSSGTTGSPVTVRVGRTGLVRWYALHEARTRAWYGVSRHDRWAIIGGRPVVPPGRTRPPYWVHNRAGRQLYLSSAHVGPDTAEAYLDVLETFRPTHLVAYPAQLARLARIWEERGLRPPPVAVIISNAELLSRADRAAMERVFASPVQNTLGCAEMVVGASDWLDGTLRVWPDAGVHEALDPDRSRVGPGGTGRLVCTSLLNPDQPMIRYEIGDLLTVPEDPTPPDGPCRLPLLGEIDGRVQDFLLTRTGAAPCAFNAVTYGLPVEGLQIHQRVDLSLDVSVVPGTGFGPAADAAIRARLRDRVGDLPMRIHLVDALHQEPGKKFRFLRSDLPSAWPHPDIP
jgi:phenylacetate-CoA ligase